MNLRDAVLEDSKLIYDWASDPEVRSMAFSSEDIQWEAHQKWFEAKLKDPKTYIYIALQEGTPLGQIRFDLIKENEAEIDVHTKPGLRGKGVGTQIITQGVAQFFERSSVQVIHALIKLENSKSRSAFEKAGFKALENKWFSGQECFHMIVTRK